MGVPKSVSIDEDSKQYPQLVSISWIDRLVEDLSIQYWIILDTKNILVFDSRGFAGAE